MAAKSLVLVHQRPESLDCSWSSALQLQNGASNPECGHWPGVGRVSALGNSAVLSVCRVKLFKEISSSKENGEGESC